MPRVDGGETTKGTKIPTIHNVDILDASGSMFGSKYENAISGINEGINTFKNSTEARYTTTVIEFDEGFGAMPYWNADVKAKTSIVEGCRTTTHYFMQPAATCGTIVGRGANGGTPLNQTVGETIERILKVTEGTEDKVIIRVFTDGAENASKGKFAHPSVLKALIANVEANHNFTVTFMGTQEEVNYMVNSIGLDIGNTIAHNNTAADVKRMYRRANLGTVAYTTAFAAGASQDELSRGFFKRVADEQDEETNKKP